MLIDGIDISTLNIELYDRILYSNDIDTYEDWLDGDIQPTFIRQQDRFKTLKLDFLVLENNEEDAFLRISQLTSLLKKAVIRFDDLDFTFDVSIINTAEPKRLKNGDFLVSYILSSGYARGQREVYTTDANMTNSFKLTVVYYADKTRLLANETVVVRASAFNNGPVSFSDLGIELNKHLPAYYSDGIATNFIDKELTYDNLRALQVLIVNYSPISYHITAKYFLNNGRGIYESLFEKDIAFTETSLKKYSTIGQFVGLADYRPEGYQGKISYNGNLTMDSLLTNPIIEIFYDPVVNPQTKDINLSYYKQDDEGGYVLLHQQIISVANEELFDGSVLSDFININAYRPKNFYNEGYIEGHRSDELISYETLETEYSIKYNKSIDSIFIEYYAGIYPGWKRLSTVSLEITHKDSFESQPFDVIRDLNIDLNKYHTSQYKDGILNNAESYKTYEDVLNAGVIQISYTPIDYPITINYYRDSTSTEPTTQTITINAMMFFSTPILKDIIPIQENRPEGYQFDALNSYSGEVSLEALTQASPIIIVYKEIEAEKTKNVVIKYKKELASTFSTIATNLITVSESDCIGGIRLNNLINLTFKQPEYYDKGVLDGVSQTALVSYEDLLPEYTVIYLAKSYSTPVRYYVDTIEDASWIGSSSIKYRVIDFTAETTLFDFGLDLNKFKPANTGNGILQYNGPIDFLTLLDLTSIDILYKTETAPPDPETTLYPHRFLFLEHNDLGDYETLHPEWTMNHAYINTGITADDMSKLTVVMECGRADERVPLHKVNVKAAYLFGSTSGLGEYYMRFNNQTLYGENLTGVNVYEAKAGEFSDQLILTEKAAIGFSRNSGIYSSPEPGYSRAVFTYSNILPTESAQMPNPLYLFANNNNGAYEGGLGGIGIYGCRIYYNDQLIRDMIPVSYYDKIGDLVAPSNCLYDKITNSFFEDATGKNSFNIRDDESYEDLNPQHQIGKCYVNYYKGDQFLKTAMVWFRGDDFGEGKTFNLYDRFGIDENQPDYTLPGVIQNETGIIVSFDGLNNKQFDVIYEPLKTSIEVNYYSQNGDVLELIKKEIIPLAEKDFYQAPTFGDIVRINKYKPVNHFTDFKYEGKKVSFGRVLELSPYNIIYKPVTEPVKNYTTNIVYKKKVFGVRNYETIGTEILTLDTTNFNDGEYIDFYIDFNLKKPEKYYSDGQPYHWFLMDERLTKPEDLKPEYEIVYQPETQFIDVNYYTDTVDELNRVASDAWGLKVDDLDPRFTYTLIDLFPNEYVNKYKPIICAGGVIQDGSVQHTFESLTALPEVAIVYQTIKEPHDPTEAYYTPKVLGFGIFTTQIASCAHPYSYQTDGYRIPYIDLGYRPKEIGRLKVELKGIAQTSDFLAPTVGAGWQDLGYNKWFGYAIPRDPAELGKYGPFGPENIEKDDMYSLYSQPQHRGGFSIGSHIPKASDLIYSAQGPTSIDGQNWYLPSDATGTITNYPVHRFFANTASYRKGAAVVLDENYDYINAFHEYSQSYRYTVANIDGLVIKPYIINPERVVEIKDPAPGATIVNGFDTNAIWLANPITTIMDAYHNYYCAYSNDDSNNPYYENFIDKDMDIFEARLQPKGALSLFRTTNPLTGGKNIMPFNISTCLAAPHFPLELAKQYNPYTGSFGVIEREVLVQNGVDAENRPIFVTKKESFQVVYAQFPVPVYPQISAAAVWGIKIWDRDRLVRDLIPVAKGDQIYDYTMPENGLFDLVTEIFFGNGNKGGHYETEDGWKISPMTPSKGATLSKQTIKVDVSPEEIYPLWVTEDPGYYGLITQNYYDYDSTFLNNTFINVPTWFNRYNTSLENILGFNDYKPDDFHLDGLLDLGDGSDNPIDNLTLEDIYKMGTTNILYKLRTFTKTIVYYRDNLRIGSKDIFYSIKDIEDATKLTDLGIDVDLYWTKDFKHGRIVFNEDILVQDDIQAFIDAPSPVVIYDKLTKEEDPNIFYVEYYRGGANDESLITLNPDNPNYLDCDLNGVVLNPNGAIKYYNHYHSALYEDEVFDYFIPYQVKVLNKYIGIHRGPARRFPTLANIAIQDTYTIIEERNGWGRLKEYPIGWIILSATEPITGPGQNPNYDVPNEKVATIPFKENVKISKMTIDRLWCYAPEVKSWLKAEDISYNQSGRLYNALDLDVIHLDTIDFSKVSSLDQMGIFPQKRQLFFHNPSDYVYTGDYTFEAFSNLHCIDFVYPETVYNYNCIYYKDNIFNGNKQYMWQSATGTINSSCYFYTDIFENDQIVAHTLSKGTKVTGLTGIITNPITYIKYYKIRIEKEGDLKGKVGFIRAVSNIITWDNGSGPEKGMLIKDIPSNELGRAAFSCSIGNWNPDWDVFLETSWKVDSSGNAIPPKLYRGVPLTLDWSYFGFDKNLYKPAGYPDGIYQWNARTWDREHINFTFEELIRCGTQFVFYPCFNPSAYKIWVYPNHLGLSMIQNEYSDQGHHYLGAYKYYLNNPGISASFFSSIGSKENTDIYISGELIKPLDILDYSYTPKKGKIEEYHKSFSLKLPFNYITTDKNNVTHIENPFTLGTYFSTTSGPEDYVIYNASNVRKNGSVVWGFGNSYTNQAREYFAQNQRALLPINETTDWTTLPHFDTGYINKKAISPEKIFTSSLFDFNSNLFSGVIYNAISYNQYLMTHYWVPVPRGLRFTFNGEERRIPTNGLFDLLTGSFVRCYLPEDGTIKYNRTDNNIVGKAIPGESYIFFRNQRPVIDDAYDYYNGWTYNSTAVDYITQIQTGTDTFRHPDQFSGTVHSMVPGVICPISKVCSDTANKVVGEWYQSCEGWFESYKGVLYTGEFDKNRLTQQKVSTCLVKPDYEQTYYVYKNPETAPTPGTASDSMYDAEIPFTAYYTYINSRGTTYFFDGYYWIPKRYTSLNQTELNKNYVIVPDSLPYYIHPIEKPEYEKGIYHYGERVSVPYVCGQDPKWGYTGRGWIRLVDGNVSEII